MKEDRTDWPLPAFCTECAAAFPWTTARVEAANEAIDLIEEMPENEREKLKGTLEDLLLEGPRTQVAVLRWKKWIGALTGIGRDVLVRVVADLAAATIKDQIGLPAPSASPNR